MGLDIHSAITISAVLSLMMAVSLLYTLHDYPAQQRPSLRLWIASMGLQPVAWVLYGMRGAIPDLFAIVIANTVLILTYAFQLQAVRRFVGRSNRPMLVYTPVVLVAAVEIVFTYAYPSIRMRTVWASLLIAIPFFLSAHALLSGSR